MITLIKSIQAAFAILFIYGAYIFIKDAQEKQEQLEAEKASYPVVILYDQGLFDQTLYLDSIRTDGDKTHCYQKGTHLLINTHRIVYLKYQK